MKKDKKKACDHDYDNAIRKGKMHYICPKCKKDITIELVIIEEMKGTI